MKISLRKIFRKLMAYGVAITLMHTPVIGSAESVDEDENANETKFELILQDEDIKPLTEEEYKLGVKKGYEYLTNFINYDNLQADLQCLYYLSNRSYIPKDNEDDMISKGIVYETDFTNQKYENFARAYNLINVIGDYNQSTIKEYNNMIDLGKVSYTEYDLELLKYYLAKVNDKNYNILDALFDYDEAIKNDNPEKVIELGDMCLGYDIEIIKYLSKIDENYDLVAGITDYNNEILSKMNSKLIDESKLLFNEKDIRLVHDMHENYVLAYANGRFYNDYFEMIFKELTTLNAVEQAGNASELSVEARWLVQNITGNGVMQLLRDDMQEDFERKDLDRFFDKEELNKKQWILRDDISMDMNIRTDDELALEASYFANLWTFVYDHVNDDIMKSFEKDCVNHK